MTVASLQNIPRTPEQFAIFSFANQASHLSIVNALALQGVTISLPPMDPIPMFALLTWAIQHAQIHSLQNAALNLANNDFSDVDLNNEDQLSAWIQLHWQDHLAAETALGI